jgi:ribosomal protein S15P/S13E
MIAKSIKADIVQSTARRLATRAAPEVQVLLTSRINELMLYQTTLRTPTSRRGLLRMVSRRRKLLDKVPMDVRMLYSCQTWPAQVTVRIEEVPELARSLAAFYSGAR